MGTIRQDMSPVAAVFFACAGGKFRFRDESGFIRVLDDQNRVIGSAHRLYRNGYTVHTRPFAGYVSDSQVVWVK